MTETPKPVRVVIEYKRISSETPTQEDALRTLRQAAPYLRTAVNEIHSREENKPQVTLGFNNRAQEARLRLVYPTSDPSIGDEASAIRSKFWELVTQAKVRNREI